MKIKKKVIVLIVIAIIGGYGYSQKESLFIGNAENEEKISHKAINIQGEKVREKKIEEVIHLTGSMEENEKAFVSSKIGGKVHSIHAKDGDFVKKGQLLLGLESQDYQNKMELAKATVEKAKANFESSKINYERVKTLYDEGVASKSEYDKVNTLYLVAKADLSSAETSVLIAKEALDNTSICSPINGFITKKDVAIGQVLSPGMQLMEIRDLSSVYMTLDIKQSNLSKIKLNQEVKIMVDTYKDKVFKGYIKEIAPLANESSRTFKTKILIKNKDFLLKPGMFASCNIQTGIEKNVLYIPVTSLLGKEGAYYTYIIDKNVVKRVPVKIGEIINDTVAIESGLKKDEVVAVTNLNQLKDKDPVKLVAKK
jgi:RND family efflux transporter MFP subunit